MPVKEVSGDILSAEVEAIVNPINCEGIQGKGLALAVSKKYPTVEKTLKEAAKRGEITIGEIIEDWLPFYEPVLCVLCFPTKKEWRNPSHIDYISLGLKRLAAIVSRKGIKSIAIPALGCGEGGLNYEEVKTLIINTFETTKCNVLLFMPRKDVAE